MARKQKNKRVISTALVLGSVALLLGLLLFFDTHPEQEVIRSEDGVLEVDGNFPASVFVSISKDEGKSDQSWTAVVGDVYVINPDGVHLPEPATLRLSAKDRSLEHDYAIGFFDTSRNMWMPLPTQRDLIRDVFETETDHFSHWALLQMPSITILGADSDVLIDKALQSKPAGANAYSVDVAYSTVNGDFVLFKPSASVGLCDNTRAVQEDTVITSAEKSSELIINEAKIDGSLRAIVTWTVGTGCSDLVES
jgi:hypothetical protein